MRSRILWSMGTGALVGELLFSWIAPKVIAWWFNPPVQFGINCVEPIQWALKRLQWAQLVGLLAGAISGLVLYLMFRRRGSPDTLPTEPTQ